ncbi:peptidase [Perspicuibacillus lycopersici]|uniref:peptidase n=1 Tax=Perspicuibacillus lycopersici TaxID=1325689 RepID=UPI00389A40D7
MNEPLARVNQWMDDNQPKLIRFLQQLVQEDSTRGNEYKGQAVIIEKCRELGLALDIWEIGKETTEHPYFYSDRTEFIGNPNVVATLRGSGGGKSLILNGHIDVVPIGNRADWKIDPFSGEVKEGKLYGRGSTDMKGGTAALIYAMEAIKACNIILKGDLIFESVIEEESGSAGSLATVLRGYNADGAIIPEPTNLKIFPKQQGSLWFRIHVFGKSAHGGTRYEGVNAIEKAIQVIQAIEQLEKRRNASIHDPLYKNIPIPVPINIGKIASGSWPSSVPDLVVLEGRMGVKPEEMVEDAMVDMDQTLQLLIKEDPWFNQKPPTLEWFGARWLPSTIEKDHQLVTILQDSYKNITGTDAVIEASPWGTDGGMLYHAGKIPVVIFGPGTTALAHDSNEYIELEKVFIAAKTIVQAVLQWCEIDELS